MSATSNRTISTKARRARTIKVSPVTRAIRSVLAISAAALALGGTGSALAANCAAPSANPIFCSSQVHDVAFQPVIDLTVVDLGPHADASAAWQDGSAVWSGNFGLANNRGITSLGDGNSGDATFSASNAQTFGAVQNLTAIGGSMPGAGGVSGSDNQTDYYKYSSGSFGLAIAGNYTATATDGYADAVFVHKYGNVTNLTSSGDLYASGTTWAAGIEAEATGFANGIGNTGNITAVATGNDSYAWGVYAAAPDAVSVYNDGTIDVTATGSYGIATGLFAYASAGTASTVNTGSIYAYALGNDGQAFGMYANGYGDASATNSGDIHAYGLGYNGDATGISVYSTAGTVTVDSTGYIAARAYGYAAGINAVSMDGDVSVTNGAAGAIIAQAIYGSAVGIYAASPGGDVSVSNDATGFIHAYSYDGDAIGIAGLADGNATITNDGLIVAESDYGSATGINGFAAQGDFTVVNTDTIVATSTNGYAAGIYGGAKYSGDVGVTNSGIISVNGYNGAMGIGAFTNDGTATIINSGTIVASSLDGTAVGAVGRAYYGNISLDNSGTIAVNAYGDAFGQYAYSNYGDVSVGNTGTVDVTSYAGLADGIFASGVNVDVTNTGDIFAVSQNGYWAAGIEAQSDDLTVVSNDGTIYASTTNIGAPGYAGAESFGIYATGGAAGVQVTAGYTSFIEAYGPYATGIYVESGGAAGVTNDGIIIAGQPGVTYYATGIHAGSNYPGGDINVDNSGDVIAQSMIGSTGIEVLALGTGSNGSVSNAGFVYAAQDDKYGNGAVGIVISADGDATIDNLAGGTIVAESGGAAYGAMALSFAGDANVTNAGDIYSYSTASAFKYTAYGIVAAAQNGNALVDNSGTVTVESTYLGGYIAKGIDASSLNGTTVINSGSIDVYAFVAYGVLAVTGDGDTSVSNAASGTIDVEGYVNGFGVLALSTNGDVSVDNAGSIISNADGQSVGVFSRSTNGDVTIDNSGIIAGASYSGPAVGVFADGSSANVSLDNSGTIYGSSPLGDATGALLRGDTVDVVTAYGSGIIGLSGDGEATGLYAFGGDSVTISNDGGILGISKYATGGEARGVYAVAINGDVSVSSGVSGQVIAQAMGDDATGVYAVSVYGNSSVDNAGNIQAYSYYDATGINAGVVYYGNVSIDNSGLVEVESVTNTQYNAIGIQARANTGTIAIDNSGDVTAEALYGYAMGITAQTNSGDIGITSAGNIEAVGQYDATGIFAFSGLGNIEVDSSGTIYASSYDGYATGILGSSSSGNVTLASSGDIVASTVYDVAAGIFGVSFAGDVNIDNSGNVTANTVYAPAYGLYAYSINGNVSVSNSGTLDVYSYAELADGIFASGVNTSVINSGDIRAVSDDGDWAAGIEAQGDDLTTVNSDGSIYAATSNIGAGAESFGIYAIGGAGGVQVTTGTGSDIEADGPYATGIFAEAVGPVSVTNAGAITANGYYDAVGISAASYAGNVSVGNSGSIHAESSTEDATGIAAFSYTGSIDIDSAGAVTALAYDGSAFGIVARNYSGDIGITSGGNIKADGYYGAVGIYAASYLGNIDIHSGGSIYTSSYDGVAIGIAGTSYSGNITLASSGDIVASTFYDMAVGILGVSYAGDVNIDNSGNVTASTVYAPAFGLYAYSDSGDVSVTNSGTLDVYSYAELADGIFASGVNTSVTNTGDISAVSDDGYWAAGIEAQGDDLTTVSSDGTIYVSTSNIGAPGYAGAESFGIYATGGAGGVQITAGTGSDIEVLGPYVTGIYAESGGPISITNAGAIVAGDAYGTYAATGIHAATNYPGSDITVDSSGSISAMSYNGGAGIEALALGTGSSGSVSNSGTIYASAGNKYGYGASGIVVSTDGDATIDSSGSIQAVSEGAAYGALALSFAGNTNVTNSGDIIASTTAAKYYGAYGIVSAAQNGHAYADNSGMIDVVAGKYGQGIQATSLDGTYVTNSGSISADAKYAYGVFATSGQGDVTVDNSATGFIESYSYAGQGTGIFAESTMGDVFVTNAGGIDVYGFSQAAGVFATADNGDVSVDSSGAVDVYSYYGVAAGLFARATNGNAAVTNSGSINASAHYAEADGILATGQTVSVTSSGDITATGGMYGNAYGINVYGLDSATVANSGTITADAYGLAGYGSAFGVYAKSGGDVTISNSGSVDAAAGYMYATGIYGGSLNGDVAITNSGAVTAYSPYSTAVGVAGASYYGNVTLGNAGTIDAESRDLDAIGMLGNTLAGNTMITTAAGSAITATATNGDVTGVWGLSVMGNVGINSGGSITADGVNATGIYAAAMYAGDVSISSSGSIQATGQDQALGINAIAYGDVSVANSGSIDAVSPSLASGINVFANGNASASNSGDIQSTSGDAAFGITAFANGDVFANNTGSITADGYYAIGVFAGGKYNGAVSVTNSGDIGAASTAGGDALGVAAVAAGQVMVTNSGTISAADDDYAVGVSMYSTTSSTLVNSGLITAYATMLDGQVAVLGSDVVDQIYNTGTLHGALITLGGDDVFVNGAGGDWIVDNRSTDFGSGDDALTVMAGGAIHMLEGGIYLGSSVAGNSFDNDGTIFVSGATNLIDMGPNAPVPMPSQPLSGGMNALSLPALAAVPSLNAIAFTNTGLIDFVDGMPDDMLTIVGDFAGSGDLNIDVSVLTASADILYVDGSIVDGSTQTVNVAYKGIPLPADPDIAFAYVTGDSTADAFVGGQAINYDPGNFINVKTTVTSTLDASNVTPDVFYIGVSADGLNDSGVLGASVAAGAQSLIGSQIGTWRQRVGILPEQPEGGFSPWLRYFTDKGAVNPTSNIGFGSASDFSFDQDNSGRELGINFNLNGSVNYGVLLGKADGKQQLRSGAGSDRLKLNTAGVYATWVTNAFYVDWSYRWMDFDAKLLSVAGEQRTSGNATAMNVEAGYSWDVGGFDLIPQIQYTRTKLDNIDTIQGSLVGLESGGGVSERGRLGLGLSKTIVNGNLIWTPYGSVNAIREFKGENSYVVADVYSGQIGTKGTSAMVELGVGLQTGGFSVTGGLNWTDGGAQESFVGGQVILRYSW